MKIFVAIPSYDHKLDFNVTACILEEYKIALGVGDELHFDFFPSSGGIADGRNHLVNDFLNSECDKLFFLDSDITFAPGSLIKLAHKPVDFAGGCYRYKKTGEGYPIRFKKNDPTNPNNELWADKNGLIEVEGMPFGFMCLTREVFKKFDEKFPERKGTNFGLKSNVYFQLPIIEGVLYGEDYSFALEWQSMGGKVYLDPDILLTHWNFLPTPHYGHIGNWLLKQPASIAAKQRIYKEKSWPGKCVDPAELPSVQDIVIPGVSP